MLVFCLSSVAVFSLVNFIYHSRYPCRATYSTSNKFAESRSGSRTKIKRAARVPLMRHLRFTSLAAADSPEAESCDGLEVWPRLNDSIPGRTDATRWGCLSRAKSTERSRFNQPCPLLGNVNDALVTVPLLSQQCRLLNYFADSNPLACFFGKCMKNSNE